MIWNPWRALRQRAETAVNMGQAIAHLSAENDRLRGENEALRATIRAQDAVAEGVTSGEAMLVDVSDDNAAEAERLTDWAEHLATEQGATIGAAQRILADARALVARLEEALPPPDLARLRAHGERFHAALDRRDGAPGFIPDDLEADARARRRARARRKGRGK